MSDINAQHMQAMGLDPALLGKPYEKPKPRFSKDIAAYGCAACKDGRHYLCVVIMWGESPVWNDEDDFNPRPRCRCHETYPERHDEQRMLAKHDLLDADGNPIPAVEADPQPVGVKSPKNSIGRDDVIDLIASTIREADCDPELAARRVVDGLMVANLLRNPL